MTAEGHHATSAELMWRVCIAIRKRTFERSIKRQNNGVLCTEITKPVGVLVGTAKHHGLLLASARHTLR